MQSNSKRLISQNRRSDKSGTGVSPVNTRKMRVPHSFPKTAAAGCYDPHAIAWSQLPTSLGRQFFPASVATNDKGATNIAIRTTL